MSHSWRGNSGLKISPESNLSSSICCKVTSLLFLISYYNVLLKNFRKQYSIQTPKLNPLFRLIFVVCLLSPIKTFTNVYNSCFGTECENTSYGTLIDKLDRGGAELCFRSHLQFVVTQTTKVKIATAPKPWSGTLNVGQYSLPWWSSALAETQIRKDFCFIHGTSNTSRMYEAFPNASIPHRDGGWD